MQQLERSGARWMDVDRDAQRRFNSDVQQRLDDTVWTAQCHNWYKTESGRVVNNWPGFTFEYRRLTRRPNLEDFTLAAPAEG